MLDINELIFYARQMAPQFASSCCIVNGAIMDLNEVQSMGCQEFGVRSKLNMPSKLYKYFPNVIKKDNGKDINYSIQALENNTVFMQAPC